MTAEVVVMNKSAVALAADSAVTVSSGRRGIKTYETVNKLFELIKGSNVGVMIYANAEINGVPWETVIKSYRKEFATFRAPFLEDYAEHFERFVAESTVLLRAEDEAQSVSDLAYWHLLYLFEHVRDHADDFVASSGRVVKKRLYEVVESGIRAWQDALSKAKTAPWSESLSAVEMRGEFGGAVADLVDELFASFELPNKLKVRIIDLTFETFAKCISEPTETGLVIAGFGTQDYFPKMYTVDVRGRLLGVLRSAHPRTHAVTLQEPAFLDTFAQDEQAWGWLSGITSDVRSSVIKHWSKWVRASDSFIRPELLKLEGMSPEVAAEAAKVMKAAAKAQFDSFLAEMNRREREQYVGPVLASVAALPKDELGVLAESLVNVTSLKQRVSIFDANTVGGAIDVALISIGDGFVWLNRKHYFSPDLNPAWHLDNRATLVSGR